MRINEINTENKEFDLVNELGIIVPGVNTTVDVQPGETERQAAKFGSKITKDGPPLLYKKAKRSSHILFNLGLVESTSDEIKEYIRLLKAHDWFYSYSDDHRVYLRGEEEYKKLRELMSKLDPDGKIWKQYSPDHVDESSQGRFIDLLPKKVKHALYRLAHKDKYKAALQMYHEFKKDPEMKKRGLTDKKMKAIAADHFKLGHKEFDAILNRRTRYI